MDDEILSFEGFHLVPSQRLLLHAGRPVRLGSRAFDLLVALASAAGEVVAKDDLMARVWPGTFVEEASLRVHVGALRKALGGRSSGQFVANIPGRGYCFVAPVARQTAASAAAPAAPPPDVAPPRMLPLPVTRIIGRDEDVAALSRQLEERRLLTIVGPGGMGKTTVAVAVAEAVAARFPDGIVFVDLAPVPGPAQVPGALAAALGLATRTDGAVEQLVGFLKASRLLAVLDSCEHVVDAAAGLAETLLRQAPDLRLLVTSREPLRIDGEWVHRLRPLAFPDRAASLPAAEALAYPAVQLFVERASSQSGGYELTEADAPLAGEICRRLDGIALAIELAAGHIETIGIRGLAAALDDCFRVLTRGRRTALPRHQTLRATLDWSFGVLPAGEQEVLRRLAVFSGGFTLEAARCVVGDPADAAGIDDHVMSLIAKSLIAADIGDDTVRYRLLDTTRAYAREKLERAGEAEFVRRRHAEYFRAVFERAEAEWETRPTPDWLADYGRHVANLRAALDWAFSPSGDPDLGTALSVAAVPFWYALALLEECQDRVGRSLAHLEAGLGAAERPRMKLYAALGWPQMRAMAGLPHGAAAWEKALEIASSLGDVDYQLRALWALWVDRTNRAEPRAALELADRYASLAALSEPPDRCLGDRMRARSLYLTGDLCAARECIDRMLESYVDPVNRSHTVRFQYDQRATARITHARLLWIEGHPERALREVADNVGYARSLTHHLTLSHVLSDAACPIALASGDLTAAEGYIAMLRSLTARQALDVWGAYAECYAGDLLIQRGDPEAGLALLQPALAQLERTGFILYRTAFLAARARGLADAGRPHEASAAIGAALAQCRATGEGWCLPELLRLRGEVALLLDGDDGAREAEAAFARALDMARAMGAPAWELRSATSIARLCRMQGRRAAGCDALSAALDRTGDGLRLPDGDAAATLLAVLRAADSEVAAADA